MILKKNKGAVLLLVLLLLLAFFAVLAGMQTLVVVQAGVSTQALEQSHGRYALKQRCRMALQEALQGSLDRRDLGLFDQGLSQLRAALDCGEDRVVFRRLEGALRLGSWLPLGAPREPLERFGSERRKAWPFLDLGETQLVETGTRCVYSLQAAAGLDKKGTAASCIELQSLGVPLSAKPIIGYELPEEIGLGLECGEAYSGGFGFRTDTEGSIEGALRAEGALPYGFRRKASLAQLYAELFSAVGLDRLRAAAGTDGFVRVQGGHFASGKAFSGLALGGSALNLDLGAGDTPQIVLVSALDNQTTIILKDERGDVAAPPLLVLVHASAGAPARVRLGNCARSVILVGVNIRLEAEAEVLWRGGLILSPDSTFEESIRGLHVAHLSCHRKALPVHASVFADLPSSPAAVSLYPRIQYVMAEESVQ